MTREEALGYHKKVHKISVRHLENIKKLDPVTKQVWLANLVHTLGDIMYNETGIEAQELDCQTTYLELEGDEEYQKMDEEYSKCVQNLNLSGAQDPVVQQTLA